jgi:hypothetical protein
LLRKCIANGLLPSQYDSLLSVANKDSTTAKTRGSDVSSGFHLEVSNTLKTIRVKHKDEVCFGEFIADIVIDRR